MEAGEAQVIVRTVYVDVRGDVVLECLHEGFEVFLAANFAKVLGGEVGVHAGAVPVALDGLAIEDEIHFVLLAETHHQVASHPGVVGGLLGALGEDLELPLALGHLGIDAFVIDAGGKTEFEVLIDNLTGNAAHVLVADAAVVGTLRSGGMTVLREAERTAVLVKEVLLFEADPEVWIVFDGGAGVGGVGGAIRMHDFAQNEVAVFAGGVWIESHRLQNAV